MIRQTKGSAEKVFGINTSNYCVSNNLKNHHNTQYVHASSPDKLSHHHQVGHKRTYNEAFTPDKENGKDIDIGKKEETEPAVKNNVARKQKKIQSNP